MQVAIIFIEAVVCLIPSGWKLMERLCTTQSQMVKWCTSCNKEISVDQAFCCNCGTASVWARKSEYQDGITYWVGEKVYKNTPIKYQDAADASLACGKAAKSVLKGLQAVRIKA